MQGANVTMPGEQTAYSFAQGTDTSVRSVFSRYQELSSLPVGKAFVSASGATMIKNALGQAQAICKQTEKPDRIIMLLGSNDVCNSATVNDLPAVEDFQKAFQKVLDTLGAPDCGLPTDAWVHVLSMPRVDQLQAAGKAKDSAAGNSDCQSVWLLTKWCLIVTSQTSQQALSDIGVRINSYNQAIADEVAAANSAHGGTAGVRFTTDWQGTSNNTSVGTVTFGPDDLSSLDCFHPSVIGQRKLACIAWETWELGNRDVTSCLE